jgi:hypothetical protein
MSYFAGVWILVLVMNGYTTEYTKFKTNAECEEHRKTVSRALKQAESKAEVFCQWQGKPHNN